jgi:asparagine synthase (glutamine-hydrolysing)
VCGIAGLLSRDDSPLGERDIHSLNVASKAMRHRGPDDDGLHISDSRLAAFAHRRLSIIDPTPEAHQPMLGARGTMLVFNGEIYNYKELITEYKLQVPPSDTAVLLSLLETRGISILSQLRGFFSFAYWDDNKRELILARDAIGKKPLYHGIFNNRFFFASEIRALVASGLSPLHLSPEALARYLRFYCVPHPDSMLKGVQMLPPGSILRVPDNGDPIVERWHRLPEHHSVPIEYEEARRETRRILERSVHDRLVSDVPVGAFLSGGLDSNAIVALAMKSSTKPIETFSIGFTSATNIEDETPWAKLGTNLYGTSHHECKISDTEIANLLPDFFQAMDSPSGDGLNSFLVSLATRRASPELKVVLSGVGGDESFLGYNKFRWLARKKFILKTIWSLPDGLRASFSELLMDLPRTLLGSALRASIMPENSRCLFSKKEIRSLSGTTFPDDDTETIVHDELYALLRSDIEHYLPDMLLRDLDAMTMSQSLEARAPFLDMELLEFTWQLPLSIKARGATKQLLSDSVSDILPKALLQKPKTGFELPMREWLMNGTLRRYLDELTSDSLRIVKDGWIEKPATMKVYRDFLSGKTHYLKPWCIIVLEQWYRSIEEIATTAHSIH